MERTFVQFIKKPFHSAMVLGPYHKTLPYRALSNKHTTIDTYHWSHALPTVGREALSLSVRRGATNQSTKYKHQCHVPRAGAHAKAVSAPERGHSLNGR